MTIETDNAPASPEPRTARLRNRRSAMLGGIGLAVLAVGAAAGAGGTKLVQRFQPQSVMLLEPASINTLKDSTLAAVKGRVAEIFGNKFIVQDGSGRALVDLGPRGESGSAVKADDTVTVQGRFDRGVLHANVVTYPDGRSQAFGPPKPPRPDRVPDGRRAERGPDRGPPPPPPGTDRAPPPPPAAERDVPPHPPADPAQTPPAR